MKNPYKKWKPKEVETLRHLYSKGITRKEIGKMLGRQTYDVANKLCALRRKGEVLQSSYHTTRSSLIKAAVDAGDIDIAPLENFYLQRPEFGLSKSFDDRLVDLEDKVRFLINQRKPFSIVQYIKQLLGRNE